MEYKKNLNDAQLKAVQCINGPLLVLAGAGTGKTRVLTSRLAHILLNNYASPEQILATTFTNKAAEEMRRRVETITKNIQNDIWMGTFHSLASRILRQHADLLGLDKSFGIVDVEDQKRILSEIIKDKAQHYFDKNKQKQLKFVMNVIQKWKDRGINSDQLTPNEMQNDNMSMIGDFYQAYQERLLMSNLVDFGDLMMYNVKLFKEHPDILLHYRNKFKYILVDEYQDTNTIQYLWLRLLAQEHKNICCVGDDDQSIYGWRGAEIRYILNFTKDFPSAETIKLEQNYRSTPHILFTASSIISCNKSRLGKNLHTDI